MSKKIRNKTKGTVRQLFKLSDAVRSKAQVNSVIITQKAENLFSVKVFYNKKNNRGVRQTSSFVAKNVFADVQMKQSRTDNALDFFYYSESNFYINLYVNKTEKPFFFKIEHSSDVRKDFFTNSFKTAVESESDKDLRLTCLDSEAESKLAEYKALIEEKANQHAQSVKAEKALQKQKELETIVNSTDCPVCKAEASNFCVNSRGKTQKTLHKERVKESETHQTQAEKAVAEFNEKHGADFKADDIKIKMKK